MEHVATLGSPGMSASSLAPPQPTERETEAHQAGCQTSHTHRGPVCNPEGRAPCEDLGTHGIHQAFRPGEPSRGSARFLEANCLSLR